MKLGVVGLGLIGGSMALELKSGGFAAKVYGVERSELHARLARDLGLVDEVVTLDEAIRQCDLIVVATPVSSIADFISKILDAGRSDLTVTDVGSTKGLILKALEAHPFRRRYVPTHPMAGTEHSGPQAAHLGLFKGKAAVICNAEECDPDARASVEHMYEALGMRLISMNAEAHDLHAAYVSHLSHISSFVLANTVLDKERDVDAIFNLASGGFESTVRLAKSSPDMWTPIFEQNHEWVSEALDSYIDHLKEFQRALKERKFEETRALMGKANEIKRVLNQIGTRGEKK